ncbi:MAG: RHS repeat-associated core domain-containing protein [Terracidiphilus sp.]
MGSHAPEEPTLYFGARYYGSSMGRFLSPDPSGLLAQHPEDPQSWNLYAYARNNPLILIDPNGLDCVYVNSGDKTSSVDHNSSSGECGGSEGTWLPGYVNENWVHYNDDTQMWQVASDDGTGKDETISYSMFAEGAVTRDDGFCTSGCSGADFSQANANWLNGQLKSDGIPGMSAYLHFLTSREEVVKDGIVKDLSAPLDVSSDHWAGPGGMGPPGGKGDWAASVHDYSFQSYGITIQNTGHYFGLHLSPATANALIRSNNTLIRNAGGVQAVKMGLFFGVVNAFQGYVTSWK